MANFDLIKPLIGRRIEWLSLDDLRRLMLFFCQLVGLAYEEGILTLPEAEHKPEPSENGA